MSDYKNLSDYGSEKIETYIDGLKKSVEFGEDIRKLMSNRLFKKVIMEGFCLNECARHLKESLDTRVNPEARQAFRAMAEAAGHLEQYLENALKLAEQAESRIYEAEQALDQARAEEASQ